jgi:hypothetical protein
MDSGIERMNEYGTKALELREWVTGQKTKFETAYFLNPNRENEESQMKKIEELMHNAVRAYSWWVVGYHSIEERDKALQEAESAIDEYMKTILASITMPRNDAIRDQRHDSNRTNEEEAKMDGIEARLKHVENAIKNGILAADEMPRQNAISDGTEKTNETDALRKMIVALKKRVEDLEQMGTNTSAHLSAQVIEVPENETPHSKRMRAIDDMQWYVSALKDVARNNKKIKFMKLVDGYGYMGDFTVHGFSKIVLSENLGEIDAFWNAIVGSVPKHHYIWVHIACILYRVLAGAWNHSRMSKKKNQDTYLSDMVGNMLKELVVTVIMVAPFTHPEWENENDYEPWEPRGIDKGVPKPLEDDCFHLLQHSKEHFSVDHKQHLRFVNIVRSCANELLYRLRAPGQYDTCEDFRIPPVRKRTRER